MGKFITKYAILKLLFKSIVCMTEHVSEKTTSESTHLALNTYRQTMNIHNPCRRKHTTVDDSDPGICVQLFIHLREKPF
jgi:hypothetical protein